MLDRFRDARVLVVDDNLANVQLLVALLERSGLRGVRSAVDAHAAMAAVREIDPDLVLLDLHMPKTDGYAVLESLAASTDAEYLPVLVLTADTTRDAVHQALTLGARDFLTKPFDAAEVVLRVRNLLETRYLYKALRQHNIALADELARRLADEQDLKRAHDQRFGRIDKMLQCDAPMSIVFQPIVELATRTTVGVEALSRFAAEPLRSPDLWFNEAISVGLGPELEMKAVRSAVAQLQRIPESSFLAVNVSPELVLSGKLDELVDEAICPRLVLELTENVEVEDYGPIHDRMAPLRELGARVAVDDTGAGFSSLRHILLLQPEIIKLDRSLTHGVDHDPARRALASSLVSFAQDVNANLIAEGVETAGELETLERLGTHWVQGFHIAMPEPLPA
jgi:EAL domain-containing protein (putative c-di-GMP-specific phosphodiesterase class I)/ActR/RegA family two-component response regulator